MNAAGQFIAPGQAFNGDVIEGEPPDSSNLSLWVSGLASPFLSWGERIEELLAADAMGDAESRQGAQNKAGELWSPVAGETLDWQTIANRREPYETNTIPEGVVYLTLGCDVQGDRLVYVIRGWGARSTSWLIEQGELLGDTSQTPVWGDLAEKLITPIDGCIIKLAFIDSGFRPGKKFAVPLNRIYQFCRRFKRFAFPTKGSSSAMTKPLVKVRPDVTKQGEVNKYGLELIRLDSDHWKSFIHERLAWPLDQLGAFHINQEASEDYCRQLVAESRVITDNGKAMWVMRSRHNHFLDAEAMASAAAFMLNVHHIRPSARRRDDQATAAVGDLVPGTPAAAVIANQPKFDRFAKMAARLNGNSQ
jgi:phage terminase large subunit GpA-like protein